MTTRRQVLSAAALGVAAIGVSACAKSGDVAALSQAQKQKLLSGFAVNLEMWWTTLPFEERFAKAGEAGFSHVEYWFVTAWERDAKALAALAQSAGVSTAQTVCSAPALGDRSTHDHYLDAVKAAIEEAQVLGAPIVTVTGHQNVEGVTRAAALSAYADGIEKAAPLWEAAKITCAVEPFNPYDHAGHFINGHKDAHKICAAINSPYVKMNWDLFHMQRAEGNVIDNLRKGADQIGYMQLADSPDRHQPGTGEMGYVNVIKAARAAGYQGPIGLECAPKDKDDARAVSDILTLAQALSD